MNVAHAIASFYLMFNTDLTEVEFCSKYTPEMIINSTITITMPDGSNIEAAFADLVSLKVEDFENNKEDNKEATKQIA